MGPDGHTISLPIDLLAVDFEETYMTRTQQIASTLLNTFRRADKGQVVIKVVHTRLLCQT